MFGAALCLGIGGCGDGFHLWGLFGLGIVAQDVPVLGVDGDLAMGGNNGFWFCRISRIFCSGVVSSVKMKIAKQHKP